MNEFVAMKMGEVLAFEEVGADTFIRGRATLAEVFGKESVFKREADLKARVSLLRTLAEKERTHGTILTKANRTSEKLKAMRELYVGDQWDIPVELLEWMGFFEGSAIVHCELLLGATESMKHNNLTVPVQQALHYHQATFGKVCEMLYEMGKEKVEK